MPPLQTHTVEGKSNLFFFNKKKSHAYVLILSTAGRIFVSQETYPVGIRLIIYQESIGLARCASMERLRKYI